MKGEKYGKERSFRHFILVSLGVWVTCLFITICYGNQIPMWVALSVMNVLNFARR